VDITDRIGPSLDFIQGISLEEALDLVHQAGFKGVEIVPANYQARTGFPAGPTPGTWARTTSQERRQEIRTLLERFEWVTLHSQHIDLNIASANPGIRQESVRQYLENIELAHDLGSRTCTFHIGHRTRTVNSEADCRHYSAEFGRRAVEVAEKYDIMLAFEAGTKAISDMLHGIKSDEDDLAYIKGTIEDIDSPRFGLHLDVQNTVGPLYEHGQTSEQWTGRWIDSFAGRIVEVHVSGIFQTSIGRTKHASLTMDNVQNFPLILYRLDEAGYSGPIVMEIMAKDVKQWLEYCLASKEILIEAAG
jgi:sugar phosphate isomerase/epimerase